MMPALSWACLVMLQVFTVSTAKAIEVLSARELASHCARLKSNPDGVDGQYCIRYIQGFIDGAVATDARVMLNAEDAIAGETFSERAMRTRLPSRADINRAAGLAGFCLGDPLHLRDVVDAVVADLTDEKMQDEPAMDVVYSSLQQQFPCEL
ncbi:hypothetical protein C0039_15810 [Pseudohalioglobus lutimaris]|uniref:Rap1a immunity protein domain-containing protein n=2 Tax=Pseudohalioglobus lutimaris TaxID=1737061 RepID=A0A2N5WZM7_9GAMM|nr:hypothetical protein C0039_15810 [Pseudohalioglobus lutimaris]